MKKDTKKTKSPKTKPERSQKSDFDDLGLEPPKIYKDTQAYKKQQERLAKERRENKSKRRNERKAQQENLTRNERRAIETKKRKKKNLVHKIITWFIICVLLAGVGIVLSLTVFFKIGDISVEGNERYLTEEILSQCSIDIGENLFMSDTNNAKRLLEKNLPYIYNAEVKRKLPDKIIITVEETQPIYYILNSDEETYTLLDDNFKVLESASENTGKMEITLAEIASAVPGEKIEFADENVSSSLDILAGTIRDNGFTEFTGISSEGLNNNYVIYDSRITFKLGTTQDLEKKMYQGLTTCKELDETSPNVEGELTISGGKQIYFTEK